MKLYDEYLKRHCLQLPLVRHVDKSTLMFRVTDNSDWPGRWLMVTIQWVLNRGETGFYTISFITPNHDGYRHNNLLQYHASKEVTVEWDEFDRYILEWPHTLLQTGIRCLSNAEAHFEAWQMFQFCHDTWITKQPYEIQDIFFDSIDLSRSQAARKMSQEQALLYLQQECPTVFHAWKYDILGRLAVYADWLCDLIGYFDGTKNRPQQRVPTGLRDSTSRAICVGCETTKNSSMA